MNPELYRYACNITARKRRVSWRRPLYCRPYGMRQEISCTIWVIPLSGNWYSV